MKLDFSPTVETRAVQCDRVVLVSSVAIKLFEFAVSFRRRCRQFYTTVLAWRSSQSHVHRLPNLPSLPLCTTNFPRCCFAKNAMRFVAIAASRAKSLAITVRIVYSKSLALVYEARRTG